MRPVYLPILKRSITTLLHIPSIIFVGLPIALASLIPQPFGYLGWPNLFSRLLLQYVAEPLADLSLPESVTLGQYLRGLVRIASSDPLGLLAVATTFIAAAALFILILIGIPRGAAALIDIARAEETGERATPLGAWRRSRHHRGALFLTLVLLPLLPPVAITILQSVGVHGGVALLLSAAIVIAAFFVNAGTLYASAYRVIGNYSVREALRAGFALLWKRIGATLEWSVVLMASELALFALAFILGSLGLVPLALLLVIFFTLKWGTVFSWLLTLTFLIVLLYSFLVILVLLALEYTLWVHLFYTLDTVHEVSFTTRAFHDIAQWWKRKRVTRNQ